MKDRDGAVVRKREGSTDRWLRRYVPEHFPVPQSRVATWVVWAFVATIVTLGYLMLRSK
jgi:hypothetical protein